MVKRAALGQGDGCCIVYGDKERHHYVNGVKVPDEGHMLTMADGMESRDGASHHTGMLIQAIWDIFETSPPEVTSPLPTWWRCHSGNMSVI